MKMKRTIAWLAAISLLFAQFAYSGPFIPGQILTAAQLNSVVDSKCTNAACAITGGTISGVTIDSSVLGGTTPAAIYNTTTNLIAASGTNQATATQLTTQYNRISSASAGTGAVLQTPLRSGLMVAVSNDTANYVNIYPQVGGNINSAGSNVPMVMPPGGAIILFPTDTLNWKSVLDVSPKFQSVQVYGTITPNSVSGIVGTTTNDNAQAGSVGEYAASSVVPTTVNLTTASSVSITNLPLTAGDYDVSGACTFQTAATTVVTATVCGISTANNLFGADGTYARNTFAAVTPGAVEWQDTATPNVRISVSAASSPLSVYLTGQSTFTTSTQTAGGFIRARRIR